MTNKKRYMIQFSDAPTPNLIKSKDYTFEIETDIESVALKLAETLSRDYLVAVYDDEIKDDCPMIYCNF